MQAKKVLNFFSSTSGRFHGPTNFSNSGTVLVDQPKAGSVLVDRLDIRVPVKPAGTKPQYSPVTRDSGSVNKDSVI